MNTLIKKSELQDHIESLTEREKVAFWNTYCQNNNCSGDEIFENGEEFFNTFFTEVMEAVRAISYGDYEYSHNYVVFNGYANLDSFDYVDDVKSPFDLSSLIEDIEENPEQYDIEFEEEDETEDEE